MLSVIIFLPLLGAVLIGLTPGHRSALIRWLAGIFSGLPLLLSIVMYLSFNHQVTGLQFVEKVNWVALPNVGVSYFVGTDGLSLPLILLTSLLTLMAVLASTHVNNRVKEYHLLLLILQTGVTGVFAAMDFL